MLKSDQHQLSNHNQTFPNKIILSLFVPMNKQKHNPKQPKLQNAETVVWKQL